MSISPFLNRVAKRDKGHAGRKAESETSKRMKGTLQPGSGNTDRAKGDMIIKRGDLSFLFENKSSMGESFSIKLEHLLKIYQEALSVNKIPALSFQFVGPTGASDKRGRWVCLPEHIFDELVSPE